MSFTFSHRPSRQVATAPYEAAAVSSVTTVSGSFILDDTGFQKKPWWRRSNWSPSLHAHDPLQMMKAASASGLFWRAGERLTEPIGVPRGSRQRSGAVPAPWDRNSSIQAARRRYCREFSDATDRHTADLAFRMNIQQLDRTLPSHDIRLRTDKSRLKLLQQAD